MGGSTRPQLGAFHFHAGMKKPAQGGLPISTYGLRPYLVMNSDSIFSHAPAMKTAMSAVFDFFFWFSQQSSIAARRRLFS